MRLRRIALLSLALLVTLILGSQLWAFREYRAGQQASAGRDFPEAQTRLERCSTIWFLSSDVQLLAGRAARQAGHLPEAAEHFRKCRALVGQNDALDVEYELLQVQQGDLQSARPLLERLLALDHPESVHILEVLTPAYLQAYQLADALKCIRRWLEREPESLEAWHYRAQLYRRLQAGSELVASYRRILELDPADESIRLQLAEQLLQARQPQEALVEYQRLGPQLRTTPAVLVGMAACQSALRQVEEGRQLLDQALAADPQNAPALAERGRLALAYESPTAAEPWLRRAFAQQPADHDVLYALCQCLQALGKNEEAAALQARLKVLEGDLVHLREILRQVAASPRDPEPRFQAGQIFLRNGKDEEGLRWLKSALTVDGHHAATKRALAEYYERHGDAQHALEHRQRAP
jgi:tetratricopeptide (TPR) repeat protein